MSASKEQQLWEACTSGDVALVQLLANDPSVNINWGDPEYNRTAFYRACFFGHRKIVEFLLSHPEINVNQQQNQGATPLNTACQHGHQEVVLLLLADNRIDLNIPNHNHCTPLWLASQNGYLPVVQLILASGREINTKIKSIAGPARWNNTTAAAENARHQGTRAKMG